MRTGKDWTSIKQKDQAPPSSSQKTPEPFLWNEEGEVSCFTLTEKGWQQEKIETFLAVNIKEVSNSNWAIKVTSSHGIHYYCGSDEVWEKLPDKQKLFLHDIANSLWSSLRRHEMKQEEFMSHSIGHLVKTEMACRILGANVQ